jgi:hypothetical protein
MKARMRLALAAIFVTSFLFAVAICGAQSSEGTVANVPPVSAEQIMARVAANQDRSEALRKEYVYKQRIHVVSRKTDGKLMREETAEYDAVPTPTATNKELKKLAGRYWRKKRYLDYTGEPAPDADSLDGDLVHDLRTDLANDGSKDGLGRDLFPLTSEEQKKYKFRLLGETTSEGRAAYRIAFTPAAKDEVAWAGEALIDAAEFQPITVYTKLARRIPLVVRAVFGTDLPGIGFSVRYARQPDGAWFPISFGTEFRLRAIFFINRDLSVSLQNTGFERTHVESKMKVLGPADR